MFRLVRKANDPLYKNSFFLMLTTFTGSILGFAYWTLAARFYPAEDVGLATALISTMNLIALISRFGFDIGVIRFLPVAERRSELLSSVLILSFLVSVLISIFFVLNIDVWSPRLNFIRNYKFFLLFILATSVTTLLGIQRSAYVGLRKAEFSFIQSVIWMSLKAFLVTFFTTLGVLGIFLSWTISIVVAITVSLSILLRKVGYSFKLRVEWGRIKEITKFSFGNYIASILQMSPQLILPILILNMLGAEESAYFYMAWMIALLLFSVPESSGLSMLSECSYNSNNVRREVFRTLKFVFVLLIPAMLFVVFYGKWILLLFGREYSENAESLLKLFAISSIFVALNTIYVNFERVRKRAKPIILVYGFIAVFTIGGSYLLISKFGLLGVGFSWVVGNIFVLIIPIATIISNNR